MGLRTTSGATGRARCIVTGIGASPELALVVLRQTAEKEAQRAGELAAQADEALEADKKRKTEAWQKQAKENRLRAERRRQEEIRKQYGRRHPEHRGAGYPVPAAAGSKERSGW